MKGQALTAEDQELLSRALRLIAPGTALRQGLSRIQMSRTGALVVLGYTPEVEALSSGGFTVDIPFSAARLRELSKMDGAVLVDTENQMIRRANVQLMPDPSTPTEETGTRHRTAQRVARQALVPVLAVSASMRLISIYAGDIHFVVEEPSAVLARANQAMDTLDRYTQRLDEVLTTLRIFEMRNSVTVRDVVTVIQRMEMIRRITAEINDYIDLLGTDGRLLALQVDDLSRGASSQRTLVLRDYVRFPESLPEVDARLQSLSADNLVDLTQIANIVGMPVYEVADLDTRAVPRGIQALSSMPRLAPRTVAAINEQWPTLADLQQATVEDLVAMDGIGPYRAEAIVEQLREQKRMAAEYL